MIVERIPKKKISTIVVEQIEKKIADGTFKAGDKLPSIRELCELFNVGRSTIRDAMINLEGNGTVYVKQGEGTFVCEFDSTNLFNKTVLVPDQKNIEELFQVRKILESGIAEGAALNHSDEDLKVMSDSLFNHKDDWESDYNFHMAIAHAAGNHMLVQFMEFISATLKKTMIEFHKQIKADTAIVEKINDQHIQIYESIKEGLSKQAKKKMVEHLNDVEKLMKDRHLEEETN